MPKKSHNKEIRETTPETKEVRGLFEILSQKYNEQDLLEAIAKERNTIPIKILEWIKKDKTPSSKSLQNGIINCLRFWVSNPETLALELKPKFTIVNLPALEQSIRIKRTLKVPNRRSGELSLEQLKELEQRILLRKDSPLRR